MFTATMSNTTYPCEMKLSGALDADRVTSLRAELETLLENEPGSIILDLSQVDFLDSSGVGALAFLYKRLSADKRQLQLKQVNGQPLALLKTLHIDKQLNVEAA